MSLENMRFAKSGGPAPTSSPTSEWRPPTELPDLRRAGTIALDTETMDGGLLAKRGSSWPWGDGHVCGISVAYRADDTIRAHYFPLRHPDSANFDREQIIAWLRELFASDVRIVTQNGLYDYGWLRADFGLKLPQSDRLEEIGALATMVDENRYRYSLDALCEWRGLAGKDETLLKEAAIAAGLPKKAKPQAFISQLPARFIGPYAEADAISTLALFESLDPVLDRENTRAAYRLECDLLPMVLEMRRRGIRIDTAAAECARKQLLQKRDAVFAELSEKLGANVSMAEIGRKKWLAETFDQQNIKYPRTEKGNPSFTAGTTGWMHKHPHWLPQLIVKADKYNNCAVNFLEKYILEHVVHGRVHAEIHPHRSDEGGTRSLRFSYSNPPLQLMPARDEELAPLIRGVFLPEGGEIWAKPDISQQEFRFIVHYAVRHHLAKAVEAAERYRNDPDADFHQLVAELTGLDRQAAKAVNFAKAFGAGVRKFAGMTGLSESEARVSYGHYDQRLPFVSQLSALCKYAVRQQGYLTLYDGARRHWDNWAPGGRWEKGLGPCSREEAERRVQDPDHPWHRRQLWRADVHKAMNALIQGSGARHTKLWMRACWREGIVPLLQMHDALECSVSSPETGERVAQLGREAVKLEVPIQVDLKFGRNWGDAKHTWQELHRSKQRPIISVTQPIAAATVTAVNGAHASPTIDNVPILPPLETPMAVKTPDERPWRAIPLAALIGEPLHNGKILCPYHDDHQPSLHIYRDHYYCFVCNARGNHIDWLRDVVGLSYDAAIEALLNYQGPLSQPDKDKPDNDIDTYTLNLARALWPAAQPIVGTPAIRYLAETRGIDVDLLPANTETVLRFHPRCPFGRDGARKPCLLALFRDVETDAFAGIHRIALTPEVFAGGKVERMTLGCWPRPRAIKLWPAAKQLFVGEGLETTLAAATREIYHGAPMRPAWAAGSSAYLGQLPPIDGVEELVILVDHDPAGKQSADACRHTWKAAGRKVTRLLPPPGKDFNDIVLEKLQGSP
jgi:DNA polymerase I-like protein with 3'-5' exonuclease and polymerase domains